MGIIRNLVIRQGETSKTPLIYLDAVILAQDLTANLQSPPTAIKVLPLTRNLPSGFELEYPGTGCQTIILTTTSISLAGAKTIQIQPYTGTKNIPCGKAANALPQDLTGEIWRGQCRRKISDTAIAFAWTFELTSLQGVVVGIVPAAITEALVIADRERVTFSDIPDDFQLRENFDPAVYSKAWVYDWERVYATGDIKRAREGLLWLTSEVTR
jgi:hypothetical protein